jgi:DNA-directed RNA polymerase specialized sigma24 family protein
MINQRTVERWKLNLVRARAYQRGFRGADLEDVQQEVLLEVLAFRFCPDRSNGATEATALIALIDRRLFMARRSEQRRLRRVEQAQEPQESSIDAVEMPAAHHLDRSLDIQKVVASLAPAEQELCRMLAAGESIEAIAARLQCGWHTVKRQVERIRRIFEEKEIDGYAFINIVACCQIRSERAADERIARIRLDRFNCSLWPFHIPNSSKFS